MSGGIPASHAARINPTIAEFIDTYREETCLWQQSSKAYWDKHKRDEGYAKLLELLRKIDPMADRQSVVKKINNLRTAYKKELKRILMAKSKGEVYTPKLWYFDKMNFLDEHDMEDPTNLPLPANDGQRNSEDSQCTPTEESYLTIVPTKLSPSHEYIEIEPDLLIRSDQPDDSTNEDVLVPSSSAGHAGGSSTPHCPGRNKKKRKFDIAYDVLQTINDHFKKPREKRPEDQFDVFGKVVAYKLREMHKSQRIMAEKIINDALFQGLVGKLTTNHKLVSEEEISSLSRHYSFPNPSDL